jgi:WD40 repeat protein
MMVDQEPYHRAIVAFDIEGFSWSERNDRQRLELCAGLDAALVRSLDAAGIGQEHYEMFSTGDGRLLVIDPTVSKARLLGPLVTALHAELMRYNQGASEAAQVRLRMVVHAGELVWNSYGPVGAALNYAFRLLDSDQARERLRHTLAPMVVIVSEWIYRHVVYHEYSGIKRREYQQIRVTNKNVVTRAWVHIPGWPGDDTEPGRSAGRPQLLGTAAVFRDWAQRIRVGRRDPELDRHLFDWNGLLRALRNVLDDIDTDRPVIISGPPGAGKSFALLGLVETAGSRAWRTVVSDPSRGGRDEPPARVGIDVFLRVARKEPEEVATMLATTAHLDSGDPEVVAERILAREGPLTIVVDGLDEAIDASRLTRDLLLPLAIGGPNVGVRLFIAGDLTTPLFGPDVDCLVLDATTYLHSADIVNCIHRTLTTAPRFGSSSDGWAANALGLSNAIASWSGNNFLLARLAASACAMARPGHLDGIVDSTGKPLVPPSIGATLDLYFRQFGADRTRVVDLLSGLAWAEGDGISDDNLWAAVASALSRRPYGAEDARWLRTTPANDLVDAGFSDGMVTYRVAHALVAEHLRAGTDEVEAHLLITEALHEHLPKDPETGQANWTRSAYHRRHFGTHASRAGRLDELLRDPAFVLDADPIRLRSALRRLHEQPVTSDDERWTATLKQYTDDRLRTRHGTDWWAAYLHLAALRHGQDEFAADVLRSGRRMPWVAQWSKTLPDVGERSDRRDQLWAASITRLVDGRRIAISGADDGVLKFVELTTGMPAGPPLLGHQGPAWTLATGRLANGRDIAVSGGEDGAIWSWDLRAATDIVCRPGGRCGFPVGISNGPITALTVAQHPDGRRIVVSGALGESAVRLWGLEGRRPVTSSLHGHDKWIQAAVATVMSDGEFVAITGDAGGGLLMWSLDRGIVLDELPDHPGGVGVVDIVAMPGRGRVVLSTGTDRRIRLWDLEHRSPIDELTAYPPDWPETMAIVPLASGRQILATGGRCGVVTIWDIGSMAPIEQVMLDGPVRDLAGSADGMLLVAQPEGLVALRLQFHAGATLPAQVRR